MHHEQLENCFFYFVCCCFLLLSYNVIRYWNEYEVCCVCCGDVWATTKHGASWRLSESEFFFFFFFTFKSQIGWALAMGNAILCRDIKEVKFNSPWFLPLLLFLLFIVPTSLLDHSFLRWLRKCIEEFHYFWQRIWIFAFWQFMWNDKSSIFTFLRTHLCG